MIIAIPVTPDGSVGPTWGRAQVVAVAEVHGGHVASWQEHRVAWEASHDAGTHGSHHARVVTFLHEQGIEVVAAPHVGPGMVRMLATAGIALVTGVSGPARTAVVDAAAAVTGPPPDPPAR